MTNREYIITQLSGKDCIDDNGASYESMVCNSIACPYFTGDERAFCIYERVKILEKALDIAIDKYTCGYPDMRDKVKNEIMNIAKSEVQQ